MSQLYHIQLKASVSETYDLSDKIVHKLEMTEILPKEEMVELLKQQLQERGFAETEPNIWTKQGDDGEHISLNLDTMELSTEIEQQKELSTEVEVTGRAWDSKSAARKDAQSQLQNAQENARDQLDSQRQKLQRELTEDLEKGETRRLREVNEILQQVYADSLKRKARQLGDIMEIHEGTSAQGEYELVIRVSQ